jgi:FkbM family methyltransferase
MIKRLIQLLLHIQRFGIFRGTSFYLKKAAGSGESTVAVPGYANPIYLRNKTSDWPTFQQLFIREEYKTQLPFVPKNIIDCGVNIGLSVVYFKNQFPNARIVGIEPETSNFQQAKKNTEHLSDVHLIKAAVWHKQVNLKIVPGEDHGNWSFHVEETTEAGPDTIPAVCISDLMKQYQMDEIDLLKMDIEGAELEVFQNNYQDWLPRTKVLMIETHDQDRRGTTGPFFARMSEYGFRVTIQGENFVCVRKDL